MIKQPKIIGLTGGIGSGKSTVAKAISELGIPVWCSDTAGRSVYKTNHLLRDWVTKKWGEELLVFDDKGNDIDIDRLSLSKIVFNDTKALSELSSHIHPIVSELFGEWVYNLTQQPNPPEWVIKESAILFESGSHTTCDLVLNVETDESTRIKRIMLRDGVDEYSVRSRIDKQMSDSERRRLSDWTIHNNDGDDIMLQIEAFLNKFNIKELALE